MYWASLLENKGFHDLNPRFFGHENCSAGHSFGSIVREFWMLFYVNSGRGVLVSDGVQYPVKEGQIFLIRPGSETTIIADMEDPWHYHWIGFDGAIAERLWQLPICFDFATEIFKTMERVENYEGNKEEYLVSQLLLLFCQLFAKRAENKHVVKARQLLNLHCMDDLSIESIAAQMNLDRRYLSRLFMKETGMSMQRYRLEMRMRHAVILLEQGYACSQIAEMTGYSDATSFSRSFKQFYGIAPSKM